MADLSDYTLEQYIDDLLRIKDRLPEAAKFPVEKWLPSHGRHRTSAPVIAYRLKKPDSKAPLTRSAFWTQYDRPEEKGEPVIRV